MESLCMSFNDAQKRSVSVTMVLVDQKLNLCEGLLKQGGEQECSSHRLRGYGSVAESLKSDLDPLLMQFIRLIRVMEATMGRQTEVIRVR